jgi:hypothetical protein
MISFTDKYQPAVMPVMRSCISLAAFMKSGLHGIGEVNVREYNHVEETSLFLVHP